MHVGKGWKDIWLFCWDYMILSNAKLFSVISIIFFCGKSLKNIANISSHL